MAIVVTSIPNPQITQNTQGPYAQNTGYQEDSLGNWYYVTMAQLGTGNATSEPSLVIYKSSDKGTTWSTIATDSDKGSDQGFGVSMVADVLHMCIVNANIAPNSHLGMYRFNTVTNLFLADDYGGPARSGNSLTQTVLSDGSICMSYLSVIAGAFSDNVGLVTWKAGVWSAEVDTHSGDTIPTGNYPEWILKETLTDRVHLFIFEATGVSVGPGAIWHVSIEPDGTVNTLQNVIASNINLEPLVGPIGMPTIWGADLQIDVPYVWGAQTAGSPSDSSVRILRGTVEANPVWTDEEAVPADAIAGTDVQPFLACGFFAVSALFVNGGLTIVFSLDNNDQSAPSIISFLYTTNTTTLVAGWMAPSLLFSAPTNNANSSPYVLAHAAGGYGVIVGTIFASGGTVAYTDLSLWDIEVGAPAPPPGPGRPFTSLGGAGGAKGALGLFRCCTDGHQFQAARMLEMVRQMQKRKQDWPYLHIFPPAGSIPVNVIADIASPVVNVVTPVLVYLVPEGFRLFLQALLQDFEGAAINPNDALWTVDKDSILPNVQAAPVNGLTSIPVSLGSFPRGRAWDLPRAYEFSPLTALRSTVINKNLGVGPMNYFVSGFFGYLLPVLPKG